MLSEWKSNIALYFYRTLCFNESLIQLQWNGSGSLKFTESNWIRNPIYFEKLPENTAMSSFVGKDKKKTIHNKPQLNLHVFRQQLNKEPGKLPPLSRELEIFP